ncbi:MAG: AzlD domain-containing protein [Eubacteriales bacterium]|nr:AzlD domain-containing protein [Eubacteriales bacterium]
MTLTTPQLLLTIAALVLGTVATRFLPFLLFPPHKKTPHYILYLGEVLPYAVIGLLVVFCLKGVSLVAAPHGLPELIAILCIIGVHFWKNNTLLSIGGGTLVYMLLVQYIFV